MSGKDDIRVRLSAADVRTIERPLAVDIVRDDTGERIESVTILRFAGHYRSGAVDAYAIKDSDGKFRVRGEFALGLSEGSPFSCLVASTTPVYAA